VIKKNILFLAQLPPPVHGETVMNSFVIQSELLNSKYKFIRVGFQFSRDNQSIGKVSFSKIAKTVAIIYRLVALFFSTKVDLVYFTITPSGKAFFRDCLFVMVCKAFGKKIVYHLHGRVAQKRISSFLYRRLYHLVYKGNYLILLSEKLKSEIEFLNSYKKLFIIPNGIPYLVSDNQIETIIKRRLSRNTIPVILFLSNMKISKGVIDILEAAVLLRDMGLKFRIVFHGSWSNDNCKTLFFEMVGKYQLDNYVKYHGAIYGEDKYKAFKDADIFLFPSKYEAFPLVLLEAMQFALPVVTTDVGGIKDIVVNGENGIIVREGDIEGLKEAVAELIIDINKSVEYGKKGRERFVQKFTLSHFERNLLEVFNEISVEE